MSDNDRNQIPRRKALLTTAGLGTTLVGYPGVAAAQDDTDGNSTRRRENAMNANSKYILDNEYWENENGEVTLENANTDEWEIIVKEKEENGKRVEPQPPQDVDVYLGKYKNAEPGSGEPIIINGTSSNARGRFSSGNLNSNSDVTTASVTTASLPNLYHTLASGEIPNSAPALGGTDWAIKMGIQLNAGGLSADANLTFQIGKSEFKVWGIEISYGENKGLCTDWRPGQFPVSLDLCIDIKWSGKSEISVGGSADLCVPPEDLCGRWLDCQYCIGGIGLSHTFDW